LIGRSILLLCLLAGCGNDANIKSNLKQENNANAEFTEICRRVAKLNMTVVTPGSGIADPSVPSMKKLATVYGINVPDYTTINLDVFAGADTDDKRLHHFIDAINSNHDIIWAMRGGYGSARLIATLDRLPTPKASKTMIGFCDVTSLNIFIAQKWPHWRVIHAPLLIFLADRIFFNDRFEKLLNILENKIDSYDICGIYPLNYKARTLKQVTGPLTGGNLTLVEKSLKTCWEIQTDGKILFLEDVSEEAVHIYGMLYHLKEAGKLKNVKALVFGTFTKAKDEEAVKLYIKGFAQTLDIPVYMTDQFGHGKHNMPLIYNAPATIHDDKITVSVN